MITVGNTFQGPDLPTAVHEAQAELKQVCKDKWLHPALPRAVGGPRKSSSWCSRRGCWDEGPWKGRTHQTEVRAAAKTAAVTIKDTETRSDRERQLALSPREALSRYEIISILIG